ncbi:adenine phosphoribosyltransferase [Apophysomyces sp. BC1034]|nr:adenine phosphoribosyltransferase [Apophysomyces sp. BC1015]KAG0177692.1 adenine phosphoribosyltransferase [Apophysomyces sp. BC1021]KAG0188010.1 adenine phosphoribosyltransferase [Apophysomyces sp. BC1034]
MEHSKSLLKIHNNFPKQGISFVDVFPIFQDPVAAEAIINKFVYHIYSTYNEKVDVVIGVAARGLLFGPSVALRLRAAFVPVSKLGTLPADCIRVVYTKQYGKDTLEIQKHAIKPGWRAIVIDDMLATGGTAAAAGKLAELCAATVVRYMFVMEKPFLKGASKLNAPVHSLFQF